MALNSWFRCVVVAWACVPGIQVPSASGADDVWKSPPADTAGGKIVFRAVMVEDQDEQPAAAGKAAAEELKAAMGDAPLKAVIVSECFEDQANKQALLAGVCSVVPSDLVFGQATYGSFTQAGCGGFDTVCLLGIGGEGTGLSKLVSDSCDFLVSIPQFGKIGSLNAGVAAGILMFEKKRQDKAE